MAKKRLKRSCWGLCRFLCWVRFYDTSTSFSQDDHYFRGFVEKVALKHKRFLKEVSKCELASFLIETKSHPLPWLGNSLHHWANCVTEKQKEIRGQFDISFATTLKSAWGIFNKRILFIFEHFAPCVLSFATDAVQNHNSWISWAGVFFSRSHQKMYLSSSNHKLSATMTFFEGSNWINDCTRR